MVLPHTRSMQLIDTHCHLHDPEFFSSEDAEKAFQLSVEAGLIKLLCVGTSLEDSRRAIKFAKAHPRHCFASVGIHPHEAAKMTEEQIGAHLKELATLAVDPKVVAVGECGFDFYYNDKSKLLTKQTKLLEGQLKIALQNKLPLSLHVRDAYEEFWPVFEKFSGLTGVLHSFTDSPENLSRALEQRLKIGINGIATFTTQKWQLDLFKNLDIRDFILETDSPFLTPSPKRGTINTPENVIYITNFMAELRGETPQLIAKATTATATQLFGLT